MLRKQNRLRHSTDLEQVRRRGRAWRHPLAILIIKANDHDTSRFAFTASRRVGSAVARNRARRRLREVIRHHLAEVEPGWDLLLIARARTPIVPYHELEVALLHLLTRAGVLPHSNAGQGPLPRRTV